jgi:hypothetical protein
MSCGIADAGRAWAWTAGPPPDGCPGAHSSLLDAPPVPLPVQALDHATGYILAAAAIRGLTLRASARVSHGSPINGGACVAAYTASTSLARVASLLVSSGIRGAPPKPVSASLLRANDADYADSLPEKTAWGDVLRLRPPVRVHGCELKWALPATKLGTSTAEWLQ